MCQCYFTREAVAQETDAGCFDVLLLALVPVCHAARTLGDMARERETDTRRKEGIVSTVPGSRQEAGRGIGTERDNSCVALCSGSHRKEGDRRREEDAMRRRKASKTVRSRHGEAIGMSTLAHVSAAKS